METSDDLLEKIVRDWVAGQSARIEIKVESRQGRAILVTPANPRAISFSLWISDDNRYVACSIGMGSWWDRAVSLERVAVTELLDSLAAASVVEEVRRLFGHVIQLRGCIHLSSGECLTYRQLFGIPGVRWQTVSYEPFSAPPNNLIPS